MIDLVRPRVECSRGAGGQAAGSLRSRIVCSLGVGDDGPTRGRSESLAAGWRRETALDECLTRTPPCAARAGGRALLPERRAPVAGGAAATPSRDGAPGRDRAASRLLRRQC